MIEKDEKTTFKTAAVPMSGKVLWFNSQTGKGRIRGNDGLEYYVAAHQVLGGGELPKWAEVKFQGVSTSRGQRAEKVEVQINVHPPALSGGHDAFKKFIPALKTPEGSARYKVIQAANEQRQKNFKKNISYFALALIVIGLLPLVSIGISIVGCVILLIGLTPPTQIRLSESAYYSIPHSKDRNGKHRCISCGAQGVYKHTPYKSNTSLADCPKCGFELWSA